jgi:hypothetical protein
MEGDTGMTKKDYALLAEAIRQARDETGDAGEHPQSAINRVALCLARVLGHNNPDFNRDVFLSACEFDSQTW